MSSISILTIGLTYLTYGPFVWTGHSKVAGVNPTEWKLPCRAGKRRSGFVGVGLTLTNRPRGLRQKAS